MWNELGNTKTKERERKCCHELEVSPIQYECKACQQCIGEYYLDLKTFSSSRSRTEISVLTQTCRKGQRLQQTRANEQRHSVHRFNIPLVFWLMCLFTSMTLWEGESFIFVMIRQTDSMLSRYVKEKKNWEQLLMENRGFHTQSKAR